jgi:hypothetical protein
MRKFGRRVPGARRALLVLVGCLVLPLSACTTAQTLALSRAINAPPFRAPTPEMQKLCDEHDGMKIYRTAENVAGFLDRMVGLGAQDDGCAFGSCVNVLKSREYRFVEAAASSEFIQNNPIVHKFNRLSGLNRTSGYLGGFVEKPGLYRFTLEKPGHPNCRIFERWQAFKHPDMVAQGRRRLDFQDTCIATWPIENFSARYELRDNKIRRKRSYGVLVTFVKQVVDRNDQDTMAEFREHIIYFKKRDRSVYCPHDRETYLGWAITKVLKPAAPLGQASSKNE